MNSYILVGEFLGEKFLGRTPKLPLTPWLHFKKCCLLALLQLLLDKLKL